jgi:hypothetical protein
MEEEQGMLTVVQEWRRMQRELRRVDRELGRVERERRRIERKIRRREMQKQKVEIQKQKVEMQNRRIEFPQTQGRKKHRGSTNTVNQSGDSKISIIEGENLKERAKQRLLRGETERDNFKAGKAQRERRESREAILNERDLRELHSKAKIGDTVRGTPEANVFRHKYFTEMGVARKMLDNLKLKIHEEHSLLENFKALEESGFSSGGKFGIGSEGSGGASLGKKLLKEQYIEHYTEHHVEHYTEHYTKQSIRKKNDMQKLQGNFEQQLRISGPRDDFSDFGREKEEESREQIILQQQIIQEKNQKNQIDSVEDDIDSVEDDNDNITVLRDEDEFTLSAIRERLDSVEDFLREEGWIEINRRVSMRKESEKSSEQFAMQVQFELNLRTSTMLKQTKQTNQPKPQKLTTLSETMQRLYVQGLLVPSCQRKGSANSSSENEPDSADLKRTKRKFQNAHALSSLRKEGRANTSKARTHSNTSCSPEFDDFADDYHFPEKDLKKTSSEFKLNSRSQNINYIQSETPTSIETPTSLPTPNPMYLADMSVHDFYNWAFVDHSTRFVSRTVVKLLRILMREELADRTTRVADPQFSSNKARQKTGTLSNKQVIYEFSNSY